MLYFTETSITSKQIEKFVKLHTPNIARFKRLMNYYKNNHDILNRNIEGEINNKISNDFCGYIVDTITGYFIGKPIRYSSGTGNERSFEKVKNIFDKNNEQDHNSEIAKTMSICGVAFEILYMDENADIRFVEVSPEELIPLYKPDFKMSLNAAIRIYKIGKTDFADVYFHDRIEKWQKNGSNYVLIENLSHPFDRVPIVYYWNNKEQMGDFEKVMTLVDDYDKRISDNSNEMDRTDSAYLILTDMSATDEEDLQKAKKNRFFTVENGGKVEYLIKNINDTFIQNNLQTLQKNIHKFSKVPDLSDEAFSGNLTGVAISYKLWGLEQLAANKERKFKTAIRRRVKLILNVLKLTGYEEEIPNLDISFIRNMPQNLLEIVQIALQLKGTLPEEFIISLLPFVDDAKKMLELLKTEMEERNKKKDSLEYPNLNEDDVYDEE